MQKQVYEWARSHTPAIFCALLYSAVILASRPFAEVGIEDDWSYIRSAQVLEKTGHIVYNGWATAMLGPQLYLGALAFHLFGFSFTVARAAVLLTGVLTTITLHQVLLRFGLNRFNAAATTLLLMSAPIIQPLSFTFHSDIPGLLFIVAGLYCCQRAASSKTLGHVTFWLSLSSILGITGGSIRQIAWLTALVMVPSAAWLRRRIPGVLAAASALWVISFLAVIMVLHWFNSQPYSVPEHLKTADWSTVPFHFAHWGGSLVLGFPLLVFPFLVAFACRFPYRRSWAYVSLCGALSAFVPLLTMHHYQLGERYLAPYAVNILSARGLVDCSAMLGERPLVLGNYFRFGLSFLSIFTSFVGSKSVWSFCSSAKSGELSIAWKTRLTLVLPFMAAYVLLLLPRAFFGIPLDRYLIPLSVLVAASLVQVFQDSVSKRLPTLALVTGGLLALCGFIGMHDLFAFERARLLAINEIRSSGVVRQQIGGGFEYDGWTQITTVGAMSDARIRVPHAMPTYDPAWRKGTCHNDTENLESVVHPLYYLSLDPTLCRKLSRFPAIVFNPWLPRRSITIFILDADQPYEWKHER